MFLISINGFVDTGEFVVVFDAVGKLIVRTLFEFHILLASLSLRQQFVQLLLPPVLKNDFAANFFFVKVKGS
jgi:hypothetical protein